MADHMEISGANCIGKGRCDSRDGYMHASSETRFIPITCTCRSRITSFNYRLATFSRVSDNLVESLASPPRIEPFLLDPNIWDQHWSLNWNNEASHLTAFHLLDAVCLILAEICQFFNDRNEKVASFGSSSASLPEILRWGLTHSEVDGIRVGDSCICRSK